MLKEDGDVRQLDGEAKRRWFFDEYFELIVWQDDDGSVRTFQLAYDRHRQQRLFEWRRGRGLSHSRVDAAEQRPARYARTAFLAPDDTGDALEIADRFEQVSGAIEPALTEHVIWVLRGGGPG